MPSPPQPSQGASDAPRQRRFVVPATPEDEGAVTPTQHFAPRPLFTTCGKCEGIKGRNCFTEAQWAHKTKPREDGRLIFLQTLVCRECEEESDPPQPPQMRCPRPHSNVTAVPPHDGNAHDNAKDDSLTVLTGGGLQMDLSSSPQPSTQQQQSTSAQLSTSTPPTGQPPALRMGTAMTYGRVWMSHGRMM